MRFYDNPAQYLSQSLGKYKCQRCYHGQRVQVNRVKKRIEFDLLTRATRYFNQPTIHALSLTQSFKPHRLGPARKTSEAD